MTSFATRFKKSATGLVLALGLVSSCQAVELRLTTWDGDEGLKVIRSTVKEFERANPGITVKIEPIPWTNYQDKLLTQYAAGVAPDVAMEDPGNFQRFARRNALIPLNDFFEKEPDFKVGDYYKEILDAHSFRGKVYVLPRDIAPIGLIYYNKKIFDELGISYPDGTWTWDFKVRPDLREKDFFWVVDRLCKNDASGKRVRWGFSPGWQMAWVDTMVYSQGARYVDNLEEPTQLLLNDPRIVRAFEFAHEMAYDKKWMPSQGELTTSILSNAIDLFVQGRVAMFQSGIWEVPGMRKKLVPGQPGFFEWDIALAPAFRDGTRGMPTGGAGYAIMRGTKHPNEAWLLTKWLAGKPAMLAMARASLAQPALEPLAQQAPWIPQKSDPIEQQYPANRIATHQAIKSVVFDPNADYWAELKNILNSNFDKVFLNIASPKDALAEANRQAMQRLQAIQDQRNLPPYPWAAGITVAVSIFAALAAWVFWPRQSERGHTKDTRVAFWFLAPWLTGLIGFTLGPMIFSLLMSASDWDIIQPAKWRGLGNFTEAFTQDPKFWPAIKVTFIYTLVAVPLGLVVSLALALLLNTKVKGMPLYRTFYYLPSLASGVASALIWKSVFKADGGLLNTIIYGSDGKRDFLGVASFLSSLSPDGGQINWLGSDKTALPALILMALWGAGGAMVVLLAGLQGVPEFYYEAAKVDGASPWSRFKAITLPMISPALMFTLITSVIGSFQVFTQAFIMTSGGPNDSTLFFMLHLYNQAFIAVRMGYASALAWVLFAIILLFTIVQMRLNRAVYYEGVGR